MVYIIISTHNGEKFIQKCLKSCQPYQVIIIDNASEDDTVALIEKQEDANITLIKSKENIGFGQANNKAISIALEKGANYVFLLNQDAYLSKRTIERLVENAESNIDYGILSPIHLNGKGTKLDQKFSNYLNFQANSDFYSDFILGKKNKDIYPAPFVNAAGWLITKSCLEAVGGFDPIFFHYGEDDNYCQRVTFHGFKIGVVPDCYILHDREELNNKKVVSLNNSIQEMERNLKINYGNINFPLNSELNYLLKKSRKRQIKCLLKFSFKKASFFKKEYNMIKKISTEIFVSREINKNRGSHYLE